jgi:hypothetical protein
MTKHVISTTGSPPTVQVRIANEFDVVKQDRAVADKYGAYFRALPTAWAPIASPQTTDDVHRTIGRPR